MQWILLNLCREKGFTTKQPSVQCLAERKKTWNLYPVQEWEGWLSRVPSSVLLQKSHLAMPVLKELACCDSIQLRYYLHADLKSVIPNRSAIFLSSNGEARTISSNRSFCWKLTSINTILVYQEKMSFPNKKDMRANMHLEFKHGSFLNSHESLWNISYSAKLSLLQSDLLSGYCSGTIE